MPAAERTIEINRPVAEVFAFFTDPANDPIWRHGVKDIHAHGEPAVGAVIHQTVAGPMGRAIPADIEITAYQPCSVYAFHVVAGPVRPSGRFSFTETATGTSVTFRLEAEVTGWKRLLMEGPVQKSMAGEMASLDRAKVALER
jgi:uncharacterized protein YndB with AHSA1/START domain